MRTDQWNVTLSVDGRNLGTFDVKTGGDTDTTELTYMPGGMAPQISLGGMVAVAAIVLNRNYTTTRTHGVGPNPGPPDQAIIQWLLGRVGKGACVVQQQALDPDGNTYGKPLTVKGTLKRVKLPDVDSNATNAAILEVEVTPAGSVT